MMQDAAAGFSLFRCPVCAGALGRVDRSLRCAKRHSFDLARQGYVNLLGGRGGALPAAGGDDAAQLARRDAFLGRGHFDAVADTLAQMTALRGPVSLLEAGCATAYHLGRLADRLTAAGAAVTAAGFDISKAAAGFAARRHPAIGFAVVDIWRDWPVAESSIDLVLSVFAPKNFPEAARVLRPGGFLAVVYPGPDHLIELRRAFDLMELHEGKAEDYAAAMARHIGAAEHRRLRRQAVFTPEDIADAILMGPNAHHARPDLAPQASQPLTIDIALMIARKPD
jgi:23S rRNA (guanine745-N1)-methyltransferase